MIGCGIRIKDDLKVLDDVVQLPSETNQPFICPQERNLNQLTLTFGEPEFQVPLVLPQILKGIEVAMTSSFAVSAICDQRVKLACELYTDSFFERSAPAQFIALIGVLEVLKDQVSVSPQAMQLVDGWLCEVDQLKYDQLESAEAESFRAQLG